VLLVILVAAGILRLLELGASPLSPLEAAEAWAALGGESAGSSAFVLAINRALFWLFGADDAIARLAPALIGTALPLAAWMVAPVIGRRGALASAALLALSPSLVFFSRSVSGAVPGLAAALLWLAALLRHREEPSDRWLVLSGIALGVGVAAGPTFITTVLLILVAGWVAHPAEFRALLQPLTGWRPWVIAIGVAVLGSTTLLAYPDGLGAMAAGLESWLGGFSVGLWLRPTGLMAVYELGALLVGLLGLVQALRRGSANQRMLAYWALGGLVLGLFRAEQPDAALAALLPLALLAGSFLDHVLVSVAEHRAEGSALLAGVAAIAILGAHIWVSLGQFAYRDSISSPNANVYLLLVGIAVILISGVVALIWTYNSRLARHSLLLAWIVLLGFHAWGKAWELGHTHANDPRQLWVTEGTAPGIRSLVETLEVTSRRATGTIHEISLTAAADGPVLRWYLRDFEVTWVDALRLDDIAQAVITPAEDAQPFLGDTYLGTDFPLLELKPAEPTNPAASNSLRWLLHRQGPDPLHAGWIVLWLRQDVALISG
jgi:predicted membrane-bound mannosyltransferase